MKSKIRPIIIYTVSSICPVLYSWATQTEPEPTLVTVNLWADAEGRARLISHGLCRHPALHKMCLTRAEMRQPGDSEVRWPKSSFLYNTHGGPGLKLWAEFAHWGPKIPVTELERDLFHGNESNQGHLNCNATIKKKRWASPTLGSKLSITNNLLSDPFHIPHLSFHLL